VRQRLLMFPKPNPIAHVDKAAAERATCLAIEATREDGVPNSVNRHGVPTPIGQPGY
jgi:hypothetical protein